MPLAHVDEYKVLQITTLGRARDVEARQLLERVAKQVQPIMRNRQWTVHKLSEFMPRSPNLLGLNVNRYSGYYSMLLSSAYACHHQHAPTSWLQLAPTWQVGWLQAICNHELVAHPIRGSTMEAFACF